MAIAAADYGGFAQTFEAIANNVERIIEGKAEVIRLALIGLTAEGHLLIEDVPGVGKTMLAKAIARSINCEWRRLQFTPDLLPSDVTGVGVYDAELKHFVFKPGPIFSNIVLGDEINRASPKTQSALLLDRFIMRLSMGYPDVASSMRILERHGATEPVYTLDPVVNQRHVVALIEGARSVHAAEALKRYIVELAESTRTHPGVSLGASPRACLFLLRAARAKAASEGRDFVLPDDVKSLAKPVLSHRLLLSPQAQSRGRTQEDIVTELLSTVPVPSPGRK